MGSTSGRNELLEVADKVKSHDLKYLETIVPETLLNLDKALNYKFVIDQVFVQYLDQIKDGLDIKAASDKLETKLTDTTIDPITGEPKGIDKRLTDLMKKITDTTTGLNTAIADAKSTLDSAEDDLQNATTKVESELARPKVAQAEKKYNKLISEKNEILKQVAQLEAEKKPISEQIKKMKDFWTIYESMIKGSGGTDGLQKRINDLNSIAKNYKLSSSILGRKTFKYGEPTTVDNIDLTPSFEETATTNVSYALCDPDTQDPLPAASPGEYTVKTSSGETVKIKGIKIDNTTKQVQLQNVTIDPANVTYPVNIRLSVRGRVQDSSTGINLDCHKNFDITLNDPDRNITRRNTSFQAVESNLTNTFLQARLRQEFETKFNKLQREAFEKALSTNPEFAKLNQAQKDRLYQRMQEIGTISTGAVNVKLGDNIPPATGALQYAIPEILFSPSTHYYSIMPRGEDYAGFSVWLANQAPKDVLAKDDKYKEWLTNGLVASMDNGKTHYEAFFADVLKKFTDNVNVKTTLNQTLLDFINDTNTADHMAFDADLLANLTSPQKPDYLGFFQGQSQEFKTESITVGGKTFGYSGKLEIQSPQSMIVSLKMKDGQEQIHKSGTPVGLVRELLRSPDIEPPHVRFHAGLSIAKSIVKLARANGISLRSALTPDMLDTLPIGVRNTLTTPPAENPMVEIEERDGKLVAKVFNLNLTTRRKENEYKMFDEQDFIATQSVRDLRQGVESLLSLTGHVLNDTYTSYREASRGGRLRKALLSKHRYGGLMNFWKTISFEGESITIGGKTVNLDCKNGLFTFTGPDLKKPISGRNLGQLLIKNPALRGIELKVLHIANEKMIETYQEKLQKKNRLKNYGVIDEVNHRVYILDKDGNLGYVDNTSQDFVSRWRQYSSGHSYGRIKDSDMPIGFRIMKKGKDVVDKESYDDFLRNETVVGPMVRAMSRTYRAVTTWAPWD